MIIERFSRSREMEKDMGKDQKGRKKAYDSPKLISFGEISTLTQAGGLGPASDSGNNMMAIPGASA